MNVLDRLSGEGLLIMIRSIYLVSNHYPMLLTHASEYLSESDVVSVNVAGV